MNALRFYAEDSVNSCREVVVNVVAQTHTKRVKVRLMEGETVSDKGWEGQLECISARSATVAATIIFELGVEMISAHPHHRRFGQSADNGKVNSPQPQRHSRSRARQVVR